MDRTPEPERESSAVSSRPIGNGAIAAPAEQAPQSNGGRRPRAASRRRRRPRQNGSLSLIELGHLVEQFPQLDWSPVLEAAAEEERRRAATYAA